MPQGTEQPPRPRAIRPKQASGPAEEPWPAHVTRRLAGTQRTGAQAEAVGVQTRCSLPCHLRAWETHTELGRGDSPAGREGTRGAARSYGQCVKGQCL